MRTILVISTEAFAENIRSLRNRLGWSKEVFCRHFDMELWMLDRIETGDHREGFDIYLDSFQKITEFCGLDGEKLIFSDYFAE